MDAPDQPAGHPPAELPPAELGARIRLAREAAGMSSPQLGRAAGVSKAHLSNIENGYQSRAGVREPFRARDSLVARIAITLGASPDQVGGSGESGWGRPRAAEIMREEQRRRRPRPAPPSSPPPGEEDGAAAAFAGLLSRADPLDVEMLQIIGRAIDPDGRPYSWERKLGLARKYLRPGEGAADEAGTGLTPRNASFLVKYARNSLLRSLPGLHTRVDSYATRRGLEVPHGLPGGKEVGGRSWACARPAWRPRCPAWPGRSWRPRGWPSGWPAPGRSRRR